MAELRQIEFFTVVDEDTDHITEMNSLDGKHIAVVSWALYDPIVVTCSCNNLWKIPLAKATKDEIKGTFNSHLSYFARPGLKVD